MIWAPISTNPYAHMKTTLELPDALLERARRHAKSHNMTMKALIEQGLRSVMAEKAGAQRFKLRDGSYHGEGGLAPEFRNAGWDQIRDAIYPSVPPSEGKS